MPVTLTATLVPSGDPNPVQVVLAGVPSGTAYTVTGTALESSWPVPGGQGVSTGAQVILVDNRSALNAPVTYTATVGGVTYAAAPVTVAFPDRYVLQSLDGQTAAQFVWRANGLPREYEFGSHASAVPGRRRPPVRFAPGGDGGGSLSLRADRANTARLEDLLLSGRPLVLRTDGAIRDLPAVDLILPRSAGTVTWDAVTRDGVPDGRVWSISYLLVDDPEPSTVLSAWTWDDFDAAMASRTWTGATLRQNLLTNPSAEVNAAGWSTLVTGSTGALTLSRVSDAQPPGGGSWAFQLNAAALATTTANIAEAHAEAPALPGERHTFQAQVRWVSDAAPAGAVAQLAIEYGTDVGMSGATTVSATVPVSQLTYAGRVVTASAVAPAGTTRVRVSVQILGGTSAGSASVRWDMALVETGTVAGAYFDGSSPDTSGVDHSWTGPAHASTSTAQTIDPASFDAIFAGTTWDFLDTYSWGQL